MAIKHERKFLIRDIHVLTQDAPREYVRLAYLWHAEGYCVRIRSTYSDALFSRPLDDSAVMAIKGPRNGSMRYENRVPIDSDHAGKIMRHCTTRIDKTRYTILSGEDTWLVDVFLGANKGLVLAEFHGTSESTDSLAIPGWVDTEVTDDVRYDNFHLATEPYTTW